MEISFHQVSKRYNYDWIFKNVDYQFNAGQSYALTGHNGSGKSTLLRVISGHLTPSKGKVEFSEGGKKITADEVYRRMSFAAPYVELIEELTLLEALHFHERFKPFRQALRPADLLDLLAFSKAKDKQVRHFSSGMKQRLKLALAFCSETPLLLLDEPTTNLDKQGVAWYRQLVERFAAGRLLVVASNVEVDFDFCERQLSILDYK